MQRPISMEKACLMWRKQYTISGSKRQISFLATLDTCFPLKRNICSFGTQAANTVNLTEGYLCVHSRTISLQTLRRYGTSQCGQDRDEFTY